MIKETVMGKRKEGNKAFFLGYTSAINPISRFFWCYPETQVKGLQNMEVGWPSQRRGLYGLKVDPPTIIPNSLTCVWRERKPKEVGKIKGREG